MIKNNELNYQVSSILTPIFVSHKNLNNSSRRFCGLEKIFQMLMTRTFNSGCNLLNPNLNQKYESLILIGVQIVNLTIIFVKRIRILKERDLKLISKLKNTEKYFYIIVVVIIQTLHFSHLVFTKGMFI